MNIRSILLVILLLPMLLYLLVQSILSGILYLNQYHLDITLDQWNQKQSPISLNEWKAAEALALALLKEHENDASVVNAVGRLYLYRSTHLAENRKQRLGYGSKALNYYQTVTRLRPAWSYGWMNFAIAKARTGSVDREFIKSLMQVLRLDPWGKKTLPVIVRLGLFAWEDLGKTDRQALLEYFAVVQGSRKADIQKVLNASSRMELYCALLARHGSKASFCP